MSAKSLLAQLWVPLTVAATSTTAAGFATNILTADNPPAWWWLVLAAGVVGIVASGLWGYRIQSHQGQPLPNGQASFVQRCAGGAQQAASGPGVSYSISATDHSAAAVQMGEVNIGDGKDEKPNSS